MNRLTAPEAAYIQRKVNILLKLDALVKLVERHDRETGGADWAAVGDLVHVDDILRDAVTFMNDEEG